MIEHAIVIDRGKANSAQGRMIPDTVQLTRQVVHKDALGYSHTAMAAPSEIEARGPG